MDLKPENLSGDEEHGTRTAKTNHAANTRPDANTNTAITTIPPSCYIWPGTNSGNHKLTKN